MTDRNAKLLNTLKKDYPDAKCELNFDTPFQLLVAVVLSAQCTDKRVNIVTESETKRQASLPASLWAATLCPSIPTFSGSRTGSGCRTEKLPTP